MNLNSHLKISTILIAVLCMVLFTACTKIKNERLEYYDISQEMGHGDLYNFNTIDNDGPVFKGGKYLAHPDYILKREKDNSETLYTFYVRGHGRGETVIRKSLDKGRRWSNPLSTPNSFKNTQETPTAYTLDLVDDKGNKTDKAKYLLISGRPGWSSVIKKGEGFDVSTSDDCEVWSEHENFFGPNAQRSQYRFNKGKYNPIVAMASLIQLKENGKYVNKWMGVFHDYEFHVYKTILTFSNGQMNWTMPKKMLAKHRVDERKYSLCEPCVIRSENKLLMIFRCEKKNSYSRYSISEDEGLTWSKPKELPRKLSGHRHKVLKLADGKYAMIFRQVDFRNNRLKKSNFISRGFFMYIGTFEEIVSGDGNLFKLGHPYLNSADGKAEEANKDNGYGGIVQFEDGTVSICTYGKFDREDISNTGIYSKTFHISELYDAIANNKIEGKIKYE